MEHTLHLTNPAAGRRLDAVLLLILIVLAVGLRCPAYFMMMEDEDYRKELRTESGRPYLSEFDSYLYARLTRQFADEKAPLTLRNDRETDPYITANETGDSGDVVMGLPLVGAAVSKLLKPFGLSTETVVFWLGTVLASLAAIPAYFFVRRKTNPLGGFVAGSLVTVTMSFSAHTHAGFYDTDCVLAFLPLTFLLLYAECIMTSEFRKQLALAAGCAVSLGVLSVFWRAFYAYFYIGGFCASVVLLLVFLTPAKCYPPQERRNRFVRFFRRAEFRGTVMTVALQLIVCAVTRGRDLISDLLHIFTEMTTQLSAGSASFPSADQYVGELSDTVILDNGFLGGFAPSFDGLINSVGTYIVVATVLCTVLALYVLCVRTALGHNPEACLPRRSLLTLTGFFTAWLGAGVFVAFNGVRFLEITSLPFCILSGLGIGLLSKYLRSRKPSRKACRILAGIASPIAIACITLNIYSEYTILALFVLVAITLLAGLLIWVRPKYVLYLLTFALLFPSCCGCCGQALCSTPSATDTLYDACRYLDDHTEPDAVIGSWWDYGYYFQYEGRRRTLGDGGTFHSEWNYFLGKALISDNPDLTLGIYQMLQAHGLDAAHRLQALTGDTPAATEALLRTLTMSPEDAIRELTDSCGLTEADAASVVALSHPSERVPVYIVVSDYMMNVAGVIGDYGFWDFRQTQRASVYMSEASVMPEEEFTELPLANTETLVVRLHKMPDGSVNASLDNGFMSSVHYLSGGTVTEEKTIGDSGYAVFLSEENGRYSALVCNESIADSLLVRLFLTDSPAKSSDTAPLSLVYRGAAAADAVPYEPSEVQRMLGTPTESCCHGISVWKLGE